MLRQVLIFYTDDTVPTAETQQAVLNIAQERDCIVILEWSENHLIKVLPEDTLRSIQTKLFGEYQC